MLQSRVGLSKGLVRAIQQDMANIHVLPILQWSFFTLAVQRDAFSVLDSNSHHMVETLVRVHSFLMKCWRQCTA